MTAEHTDPERSGDGIGRALLGGMGIVIVSCGIAIALVGAITWPIPYLPAAPGIVVMGYGVTLVLGCAFYNDVEVETGRFGMPKVRARRRLGVQPPEGRPPSAGG